MKNREYSIDFKDYEDKTIILRDESERVRFVKYLYEHFGCTYFLESSLVGSGKSYWWSRISASDLFAGIDVEDMKTIFVLKQKFQYNIKELDRSYTPFMTRHQGLVADKVAKNIDGSPVIRNAKKGETPDIPSNCFRASEPGRRFPDETC